MNNAWTNVLQRKALYTRIHARKVDRESLSRKETDKKLSYFFRLAAHPTLTKCLFVGVYSSVNIHAISKLKPMYPRSFAGTQLLEF